MKYSPSYLTFTTEKPTSTLIIVGEDLANFKLENTSFVVLKNVGATLNEVKCTTISPLTIAQSKNVDNEVHITFILSSESSIKLKNCITEQNQFLAFKIELPTRSSAGKIATKQNAYIPLFDNTGRNILTEQRTAEVLGELSKNLRVSQVVCNHEVLILRDNVSCSTEIANTTNKGVITSIVTSVIEGRPPGITTHEKLERTNILILPGQSYNLTFTVPKQSFEVLNNKVSVLSSFTSIGAEGVPFSVSSTSTVWYFPPILITVICSILVIFSAILFRKKKHKFIKSPHGDQSPK